MNDLIKDTPMQDALKQFIYDEMIDAGIAERLAAPIYTDRVGNEVEESQRFGLKQDTKITRPEYLLFADETGCSTS